MNKEIEINYEDYRDCSESHRYHPSVMFRNAFILRQIRKYNPKKLIDLWCWDGYLIATIHKEFPGIELSWMDYSHKVIEKNSGKYDFAKFHRWDLGSKEFSYQGTYDMVICSEVIEHIPDRKAVIDNCISLVKPLWKLVLTTQAWTRYKSDIENGHLKHFTLKELEGEAVKAGMGVVLSIRRWFPFYDMQKYVHSLFYKTATCVQKSEMNILKYALFYIVYWLFLLSPKSYNLWNQIFIVNTKK